MGRKNSILFSIIISLILIICFVNIPVGKVKNVKAEETPSCTVTLHSNYPESWGMEEKTEIINMFYNEEFSMNSFVFAGQTGWRITCWTKGVNDGTVLCCDDYSYCIEGDVDLYAWWSDYYNYKITFNSNYPVDSGKENEIFETEIYKNSSYSQSITLDKSGFEVAGYKLTAWKSDDGKEYEIKHHSEEDGYQWDTIQQYTFEDDTVLYGVWEKWDTYNLSFSSNYPEEWNKDNDAYTSIYYSGEEYKMESPIGSHFIIDDEYEQVLAGWKDQNGDFYEVNRTYSFDEDKVFTAVWVTKCKVTFISENENLPIYVGQYGSGDDHKVAIEVPKGNTINKDIDTNHWDHDYIGIGMKLENSDKLYSFKELKEYVVTEDTTFILATQKIVYGEITLHSNYPEELEMDEDIDVVNNYYNNDDSSFGWFTIYSWGWKFDLSNYIITGWKTKDGKDLDKKYYSSWGTTNLVYFRPSSDEELEELSDLYAVWEYVQTYTRTYHSNYPKEWNINEKSVTRETSRHSPNEIDLDLNMFIGKKGYKINGWKYKTGESAEANYEGDVDLYADWVKADTHTITLNSNYPDEWNKEDEVKEITYTEGEPLFIPSDVFEGVEGYYISYWDNENWGDGAGVYPDYYNYSGYDFYPYNDTWEFYAEWGKTNSGYWGLHVTYNANFPDDLYIKQKSISDRVEYEDEIEVKDYFADYKEISDYELLGWKTADGKYYKVGDNLTVDSTVVLFADWKEKSGIKYISNYPDDVDIEQEIESNYLEAGEEVEISDYFDYLDDYRLAGWKSSDGTYYKVGDKITVDSMLVLYADWRKKERITYISEEGFINSNQSLKSTFYYIKDDQYNVGYNIPRMPLFDVESGKVFAGWIIEGDDTIYTEGGPYQNNIPKNRTYSDIHSYEVNSESSGVTFKALWLDGNTITFKSSNGYINGTKDIKEYKWVIVKDKELYTSFPSVYGYSSDLKYNGWKVEGDDILYLPRIISFRYNKCTLIT